MVARLPAAGVVLCLWTTIVSAQPTTNYYDYTLPANVDVPDGNPSGLALATNLTGMGGIIASLTVSLDISGGYNGDLYAYLRGPGGGFAVLLNRVGLTNGDAFGYGDTGFNVTFADSGTNNIHFYQDFAYDLNGSGQLTGTWQPDARAIDPQSSPSLYDSTSPTASLDSFYGTNPNGVWTLFLADLSSGGQSTVVNWDLSIETVPEPSSWALLVVGILLGVRKRTKKQESGNFEN